MDAGVEIEIRLPTVFHIEPLLIGDAVMVTKSGKESMRPAQPSRDLQ